ncbi:MAG: DedA family protein [Terriglobia bacterium]
MITRLLTYLSQLILAVISAGGYAGIVALMAVESACIPLPSEIIMPYAGYLVGEGRFGLWWVGIAGAVGCNLGSAVAYTVGARGGRPLIARYGGYVLITRRDLEWAERWFARYGEATVFFSRLLPVIRTFIALPAGIARMNLLRFHLYTFLGSLPWCLGLAYLGLQFGEHWQESIQPYFHKFDLVIGLLLLLAVVWFGINRWRELRSSRASGE